MNFEKRVENLQKTMKTPAMLVSDPADVFYYSGYRAGTDDSPFLVIEKRGKPTLFISPLAGAVHAYADVVLFKKPADLLSSLPLLVGIDENHLPAKWFFGLKKGGAIVSCSALIKKPREIKDEEELEVMKKAIRINKRVFERLEIFNKKERDVAKEIEQGFYSSNASPAFETIVASGGNAGTYIHHVPGARVVRRKDMVIVDFGARYRGYCSDITRTYVLKADRRQKGIFETVRNLQNQCIGRVRAGADFQKINEFYKKSLQRKGFAVRHGIGHGVGIAVHEPAGRLQENMVITIEPGIYIKNYGGCRIEDMVLVKKSRGVVLSRPIPLLP